MSACMCDDENNTFVFFFLLFGQNKIKQIETKHICFYFIMIYVLLHHFVRGVSIQ